MLGTGSNFAEKLKSVKVPSGWRRPATFTWCPSMSLMEFTNGECSRCASLKANERFQFMRWSASGSIGKLAGYIDIVARDCELEGFRRTAHGEEEPAALDKRADLLRYVLLEAG